MNLLDLLQMTKSQPVQQAENSFGPLMQFLAQHRSQPMSPLQMPNLPDHSGMIMQAGLQKRAQQDQYAAHLQAKAQMEAQQAAAIAGHEAELSDDPQVQAMLRSGNPQLVAYAMKIAEDEKQKKIASQYNENATFAMYDKLIQEGTPESLAKAARMMEFKKAGATNINMGEKFTDKGHRPLTSEQLAEANLPPGTVAYYDKDGIPRPIDVSDTEAEGKAALHAQLVDSTMTGLVELSDEIAASPSVIKDTFLGDISNMGIPGVSHLATRYMTPEMQEYDARRAGLLQAIEKEFSGAAGTTREDVEYAKTLVPDIHTVPEVRRSTFKRLQEVLQAMRVKAGRAYTRQQGATKPTQANNYDDIINAAAAKHGLDPDLIKAVIAKESGGNTTAVSKKDASGLMQLMPATAKQLGVTDTTDPYQNIFGGTDYLSQQINKYGDVALGLAAYNAGPGAVDKYHGIPPYAETKDYVKTIVGNYAEAKANKQKEAIQTAKQFTRNSPANKDKLAELQKRAAALGW